MSAFTALYSSILHKQIALALQVPAAGDFDALTNAFFVLKPLNELSDATTHVKPRDEHLKAEINKQHWRFCYSQINDNGS